jgi:hypothetical protein
MSRWRQLQAVSRNPDTGKQRKSDNQRASAEDFAEELQRQASEEVQ